jgi:hypothetical protein
MRPVHPEPEERPKIKRAMRAARIMKGGGLVVAGLGGTSKWYFGVALFIVICAPFFILVYSAARCPRCGQVWWAEGTLWVRYRGVEHTATEDETESMVCRRCRLDIGLGLRES